MRRVPGFVATVIVDGVHTHAASALQDLDVARTASFDDLGARACGTPDENLVEFGAPDLIRICQGLVPGMRKLELLVPSVVGRNEFRTPLLHADGAHLLGHAEPLEQRQVGRQQRLADVKARMARFFEHHDAVAAFGEQSRRGRAGGSAADDQHVAGPRERRHFAPAAAICEIVSGVINCLLCSRQGQYRATFGGGFYRADKHPFNVCKILDHAHPDR